MNHLDEAKRLLDEAYRSPAPSAERERAIAHALISIAESLQRIAYPPVKEYALLSWKCACCGHDNESALRNCKNCGTSRIVQPLTR